MDFSGDNFFVPAVKRLCSRCSHVDVERVANTLSLLTHTLSTRFPSFSDSDDGQQLGRNETVGWTSNGMEVADNQETISGMDEMESHVAMSDESDSDSGPVVVPFDEVEASIARSSQRIRPGVPTFLTEYPEQERETYQLLFAAKMEHEDILMVCARILDEANDVSLVREAAAYLEEVEAKRKSDS